MQDKLVTYLERMNFQDWLDQQLDTKLLIRQNLIAGIARGFGLALGGGFVLSVAGVVALAIKNLFF